MNLFPGVILDNRYELLELLGEGGMGQVFKARHNRLGKIFAVKSLRNLSPDPVEQAKFLDVFEQEARILAELDHPALAQVSDFFEESGTHFLVMEFIDGKTLSRVVELAPRNLSQRRVVQWATELCDVLSYLHTQDPPIIVRDLKPDNIMIDGKQRLRLIDFGISKRLQPGEGTHEIIKGMGTAEYAPLEQYGSHSTDQRSDIYSLGATLYFLLTEIAPPPAWKRASEGIQPIPPSQVNPTIVPEFESLILHMMGLRPEDRPTTIAQISEMLATVPEQRPITVNNNAERYAASPAATPTPGVVRPSTPPPTPSSGRPASVVQPATPGVVRPSAPTPPAVAPPRNDPRYGLPGSSLDRPRTVVRPANTGRIPQVTVLSCKSLRRYTTPPQGVRFCPGRPLIAVAGRYLQLWNLNTEQIEAKLWSGDQQLSCLDFSFGGHHLVAGELEGKFRQYDVASQKKMVTLGRRIWGLFPDRIRAICFLPGSSEVAVASDTSNVRIFDSTSQDVVHLIEWHQTSLLSRLGKKTISLAASRSGYLATGGADGTVSVFSKGKYDKLFHKKFTGGEILALSFSQDSDFLAVAESYGTVYLLKAPDFEVVQELSHKASPRAVSFSHDLRIVATGASDSQIRLFHLTTGQELCRLSQHTAGILDIDFSDQEPVLASVASDRRLYLTRLSW